MRALITGYSGFVGPWLAHHLLAMGDAVTGLVFGTDWRPPAFWGDRLDAVRTRPCDVTDGQAIRAVLREERPEAIYHLAGISHVPTSWRRPALTVEVNVCGSINLFEAVRQEAPEAAVVNVASGDIYDTPKGDTDLPLTEASPIAPRNPYAVAKAAQDQMAGVYAQAYGLRIVRARPFNHTAPGQSTDFVCAAFADQLARIAASEANPVVAVGNLEGERDFLDARDVARAYRLMATQGAPGAVYNVASGRGRTIRSILDALIRLSGVAVEVTIDPERFRPTETPRVYGACDALSQATGWAPAIDFDETLSDLVAACRGRDFPLSRGPRL